MNDAGTRVIWEVGNPAWEISKGRNVGQGLRTSMYHFVDLEDGCEEEGRGVCEEEGEGCMRRKRGVCGSV